MSIADQLKACSKDVLIEITRKLTGKVGDSARNNKQHYLDLLAKQDSAAVGAALAELAPQATAANKPADLLAIYAVAEQHCAEQIAAEVKAEELRIALRLCLKEIEQFHHIAYPDCEGSCPAHEAMDAAKKALGDDTTGEAHVHD